MVAGGHGKGEVGGCGMSGGVGWVSDEGCGFGVDLRRGGSVEGNREKIKRREKKEGWSR
ncbi:hypothetical protein COLO4_38249 [Corchorus olitorius]|uniref:Uncharacterized protein n=1 Tax=Corchorus olitorius TaxID=93759 RepID=A0A1R3FW18_9ROSI|nr:hypothetical protein COLO4_38249 [Corchorus olitorius]